LLSSLAALACASASWAQGTGNGGSGWLYFPGDDAYDKLYWGQVASGFAPSFVFPLFGSELEAASLGASAAADAFTGQLRLELNTASGY